jgi:hypothetical protein
VSKLCKPTSTDHWNHSTRIYNVILPGFRHYPTILQVAETEPVTGPAIKERVDVMYTLGKSGQKQCAIIIEMKSNLITPTFWNEKTRKLE